MSRPELYVVNEVAVVETGDDSADVLSVPEQGPPGAKGDDGADGAPGPNSIDDSTDLGTLTNAVADALSLLATNSAGTKARRVALAAIHRAILAAVDGAGVRSAIGAGTGNGDALTSGTLGQFAATTSAQLAGVLTDETGSGGGFVRATGPTLGGQVTITSSSGDAVAIQNGSAVSTVRIESVVPRITLRGTTINDTLIVGGPTAGSPSIIGYSSNAIGRHYALIGDTTAGGGPAQLGFGALGFISWQSTTRQDAGTADTALARNSAGVVEINNGTAGTLRDLTLRNLTVNGSTPRLRNAAANASSGILLVPAGDIYFYGQGGTSVAHAITGRGISVTSTQCVGFCSGNADATFADIAFGRVDSNTIEANNGTLVANGGSLRGLRVSNLTASGLTTLGTYTVATLPSASANAGALAQVTDSSVTTNGSTVAGGGANRVPVFSNGTNWIVK